MTATCCLGFFSVATVFQVPQEASAHWQVAGLHADGGVVHLNTNSHLECDFRGQERSLHLYRGEAR